MKSILVFFTSTWLLTCGAAAEQPVEAYAAHLRAVITANDVESFKRLPCFPSRCIDQDDVYYVFGTEGKESFIKKFLSDEAVKIKIFGPFTYSDEMPNKSYAIVYYHPAMVKFDVRGHMNSKVRREMWWKGYVETVVTRTSAGLAIHRTPFYHGSHVPWAEEY